MATTTQAIAGTIYVQATTTQTIAGNVCVTAVTAKTITGNVVVVVPASPKTITGTVYVKKPTDQTITGKVYVQKTQAHTITGIPYVQATTARTITGNVCVQVSTTRPITGQVWVKTNTSRPIYGTVYVTTPNLAILPPASPGMTVSLGSFQINESNGCILTSEYDTEDSSTDGSFYCEFRARLTPGTETGIRSVDDARFSTLIQNLEAALRIPRQRLLVQVRGQTFRDWNFDGTITAITIAPELKVIRQNARDFHYGLRVRCGYPGNVPGNFFRRESVSGIGIGLATRREVSIEGVWTASSGVTAYAQYIAQGDAFFTGQLALFPNAVDQFGTTGTWTKADEQPRQINDENSLIRASRVYAEVFAGRRDSNTVTLSTIGARRVCTISALYYATASFTAYQNYANNSQAFFGATLNGPQCVNVPNGAWVIVSSTPALVDNAGTLQVQNVYHEVVNGLRDFSVEIFTNPDQTRRFTVSGVFYQTPQAPAQRAYLSGIQPLITLILQSYGVTKSESKSVPKVEAFGVTELTYSFRWTINELAFNQGPTGPDDPNITTEMLWVRLNRPFDAQAMTEQNQVTRLQTGTADFRIVVDTTSSGGLDPTTLWDQKFRAFVVSALESRLGGTAGVLSVQVFDEEINHTDTGNLFQGQLKIIVVGGSILSLRMEQVLSQTAPLDLQGMGDGTPFSYQGWRDLPEKTITRAALCKFVVGAPGTPPVLFATGDNTVSGTAFIDTGVNAQDDFDAQIAGGVYQPVTTWMLDRREPFINRIVPSEMGDGNGGQGPDFQTNELQQRETWRYVTSLIVDPLS